MSDSELEGEFEGEFEEEPEQTEGRVGKSGSAIKKGKVESAAWVDPMYAAQPEITWDRQTALKREYFATNYGLCNKGLAPKRLRIGLHVSEADIESLFGPKVNSNGYRYADNEDTEFVERVEKMWMITHQRTSVPNTRQINVAEAKGFAYELVKNKETNWCLHGEWTCREVLRRANLEREKAGLVGSAGQTSKGGRSEKGPVVIGATDVEVEEEDTTLTECAQRTESWGGLPSTTSNQHSMAIGEWQDYLSLLDRELPTLDTLVKRSSEAMGVAKMEFLEISTKAQCGRSLVVAAEMRQKILQAEYCAAEAELLSEKAQDPQSEVDIAAAVEMVRDAKFRVDSEAGVIEHMRGLFEGQGGWAFQDAKQKSEHAEEVFLRTQEKQELWKRHRLVLAAQLKAMKAGYKRPACYPAPLPFLYLDCEEVFVQTVRCDIAPCPFCTRGFDPAWDCRFASCQHAYHSWCAYSHFSSSTKCMFKGCEQEMVEDWWVMAGIMKPVVDKGKGVCLESWDLDKAENVGQGELTSNCIHNYKFS
jgi:hypothetical protein